MVTRKKNEVVEEGKNVLSSTDILLKRLLRLMMKGKKPRQKANKMIW